MADGNKTGKPGHKIQTHDGHDGNKDIIRYQHIFIAQGIENRPCKKEDEKKCKYRPVQAGIKCILLMFIGRVKITCC